MKHHLLVIGLLCVLLTLGISAAQAQDTSSSEGWPVEQRCIGEPTQPPEGWKWDGRIFVLGIEGIRVLDADFATSYFVLFDSPFIYTASLSPDGKWCAIPTGYQGYAGRFSDSYVVQSIEVVSTGIDRKTYETPWKYESDGMSVRYALFPIQWLDAEHLIYDSGSIYDDTETSTLILDPFNGESIQWSGKTKVLQGVVSPDSTLTVQLDFSSSNRGVLNLYDVSTGEIIAPLEGDLIVWSPDSSKFAISATGRIDSDTTSSWELEIVDRMGQLVDVVMNSSQIWPQTYSFSKDGNYLAIIAGENLYLGDIQKGVVVDMCLPVDALPIWEDHELSWSPYGNQLAFSSNNQVVVLNVETGEYYTIASKIGQQVVAWGQK